ncbi:MAG: FAD-dependent oxidoreductase [Anaerolineae bacterium]|nr:FAD-dependent oxidoreductase [Anaerolineae bacterium]
MLKKTIIVGGGLAGMSCALKLEQAGLDYLLISDRLGGRVMYSMEEKINYGAYFVMNNYKHATKLLSKTNLVNPLHACFHNSLTERFAVISLHTLRLLPEFINFFFAMREFAGHYEVYKNRCLEMTQRDALNADAYMAGLFEKPASEFIKEKNYERVADDYISKFAYACTGVDIKKISALDFLNVSMGILIPIHQFIFDEKKMAEKFNGHLETNRIKKIEKINDYYRLTGDNEKIYEAEDVVLATPASVTQKLLNLKEIREACQLYVFHVEALLKPNYQKYELNLFPASSEIILTARQHDGSYLIYSRQAQVDLNLVCQNHKLLSNVAWEKAMYVQGRAYLEQQYAEGLYIAGDHNGLGLEPAAISGIFAANQIIHHA